MMKKEIRIGFVGGGTGGHIYPTLAVAQSLKKILSQNPEVSYSLYYFGSPGQYAQEFLKLGIKIVPIVSFKIRRYFSLMNFVDIFKIPFAFIQSLAKLLFIMPDVLFSKGGTNSFAVVIAAWIYRIPIFIHESDSTMGLSTKFSVPFASRIGLSFSRTLEEINNPKVAVVGNPIREELIDKEPDLTQEKAKKIFGFDPLVPLILVLGGSQGSQKINEFMIDNAQELVRKYQILHQVGTKNFEQFKNELAVATKNFIPEQRSRYKIVDFLKKEIKDAYIACDIIVSRAGSGAIFEIAASKKPSILIPLDSAAKDHQRLNAYEYAKAGACVVIEEDNFKPAMFLGQIDLILSNKSKYQSMAQAAENFSKPKAAEIIAKEIINLLNS